MTDAPHDDNAPREGEAPAEPLRHATGLEPNREGEPPAREGEAPAEPLGRVPESRLRGSVALPSHALALPNQRRALPVRRHPVHGIKYVDGQPTIIFDTLCVKRRRPVLACDEFHRIFREVAEIATAWLIGRYVIMPDHIHFFAGDVGCNIPYENWVAYLKSQLTKALGVRGSRRAAAPPSDSTARREPRPPGREPRPPSRVAEFRWLTDYWDVRVRNGDAYEERWRYFLNNPVRKGLVVSPEEWPYQGEVYELRWN